MAVDLTRLKKIFDVLLEAAFEVSQADIGSVMFLDQARQSLRVEASKGIPEEIARTAKVRIGEGISGIAAEGGRPLLITKEILVDQRLRPYLLRPLLSSSMVIPIKVEDQVVGVLNLGTLQGSTVRFNAANLPAMSKLANLVGVAIAPAK